MIMWLIDDELNRKFKCDTKEKVKYVIDSLLMQEITFRVNIIRIK